MHREKVRDVLVRSVAWSLIGVFTLWALTVFVAAAHGVDQVVPGLGPSLVGGGFIFFCTVYEGVDKDWPPLRLLALLGVLLLIFTVHYFLVDSLARWLIVPALYGVGRWGRKETEQAVDRRKAMEEFARKVKEQYERNRQIQGCVPKGNVSRGDGS